MEEIIVYPKRGRMVVLGIVCILTALFGLLLALLMIVGVAPIVIGLVGILIFLICSFSSIFYFKRVFTHQLSLIVSKEGITDNSSYIGVGLVKWEEIEKVEMINVSGQPFMAIYTYDPDLIVNRTENTEKILNETNQELLPSQVNIPIKNLAISIRDLLEGIVRYTDGEVKNSL